MCSVCAAIQPTVICDKGITAASFRLLVVHAVHCSGIMCMARLCWHSNLLLVGTWLCVKSMHACVCSSALLSLRLTPHAPPQTHITQQQRRTLTPCAWYLQTLCVNAPGGGCGVGVGLGWGYGAAWGSNYIIVDPEFGNSNAGPGKPRWFSQLQQQLRIAKFEKDHKER